MRISLAIRGNAGRSTHRSPLDRHPAGDPKWRTRHGIDRQEQGEAGAAACGDRNTRTDEHDWKHFKDGKEHTEHVDTGREPSSDPRRRQ